MSEAKGFSKFRTAVLWIAAVAFSGFGVALVTSSDARKVLAGSWKWIASAIAQVVFQARSFLTSSVGLTWGGLLILVAAAIALLVLAGFVVARVSRKRQPFLDYTEDSFYGEVFGWRYSISSEGYRPVEFRLICRECGCTMVHHVCPNCGYFPKGALPTEDDLTQLVFHRIREREKQGKARKGSGAIT